jgi:RHS repeat-associated protein
MRFDYDMLGTRVHQDSMDAGARWMLNDAGGKPLYAWDSRDHAFRTAYDALHRPTHLHVRRGNDIEALVERTVYGEAQPEAIILNMRGRVYQYFDQAGMVTHMGRNPATNQNEAYDFKGNLLRSSRQLAVEYKHTLDWLVAPELEEQVFVSSTTYDALNRPVTLTTPDNSVIRPEFNEANLLNAVRANLRGTQTETEFVRNIDFNAKGQRELIEYGNGAITTYEYDEETFRLNHLQTVRSETTLQDLRYTYDPVGNITHIQDDADIQHTIYFRNQRVEPSADYEYDAIYRLIKATGREHLGQINEQNNPPTRPDAFNGFHTGIDHPGNGDAMGAYIESFKYDAVGNILFMRHRGTDPSHPGWKRCHQYALDSNRLLSTGGPGDLQYPDSPCAAHYAAAPIHAEHYNYDAHGNMTAMPHLPLMRWDFKDQLQATSQQVVNNGGTPEITYYVYDSAGQRVRKVTEGYAGPEQTPAIKEERIYLAGFEIYREYSGDGETVTLERETLHIMDGKQRIALVETKTVADQSPIPDPQPLFRYQFGNHLGSASLELDDASEIISYEEYFPYGSTSYQAVRSGVEVSPKRYRYTGMERDEESGFSYHGARYYATWLGRWTANDPISLRGGINQYEYSSSNPIIFTDTNGLQPLGEQYATTFSNTRRAREELRGRALAQREYEEALERVRAEPPAPEQWRRDIPEEEQTEIDVEGAPIPESRRPFIRDIPRELELSHGSSLNPNLLAGASSVTSIEEYENLIATAEKNQIFEAALLAWGPHAARAIRQIRLSGGLGYGPNSSRVNQPGSAPSSSGGGGRRSGRSSGGSGIGGGNGPRRIGPAYASLKEIEAAMQAGEVHNNAHVLGVFVRNPNGTIIARWYEVSELNVGVEGARLLGHTEQKALVRISAMRLQPGSTIEFVGSIQPCNLSQGCSGVMANFARQHGIDIRYRHVYGESGTTIHEFSAVEGRITKKERRGWRH